MISLVRPVDVRFDEDSMWVELSDGRTLGVPLAIVGLLAGRGDETRSFPNAAE